MNTTALPAEITAFAAAVRACLSDLPADEVEELTDGLEADLAEAYAEDLARELPDPAAYADELRGAAGLPTPEPVAKTGHIRPIIDSFAETGRDLQRSLRKSPAMSAVLDYLVALRPAWWIVRGWAAYQLIDLFFLGAWKLDALPPDGFRWMALLALVAGSAALGLRSWPRWVRVMINVGNVLAVYAVLAAALNLATTADLNRANDEINAAYNNGEGAAAYGADGTGVYMNGAEVTNIFAYDARGRALSGVQLFDQDGKPLTTSVPGGNGCLEKVAETDECATPGAWVPTVLETGAQAWNVFPMTMAESSFEDPTKPIEGAVAQDRPAPFLKVPALFSVIQQDAARAKEAKDAKDAKESR